MSVCLYTLGALLAVDPPVERKSGDIGSSGKAMVSEDVVN